MNKIAKSQIVKNVVLNNSSTSVVIDSTNIYVYFFQVKGTNGAGSAGSIVVEQSLDGITYYPVTSIAFTGNSSNLYTNTFPASYLKLTLNETNSANVTFNVLYLGKSF